MNLIPRLKFSILLIFRLFVKLHVHALLSTNPDHRKLMTLSVRLQLQHVDRHMECPSATTEPFLLVCYCYHQLNANL